MLTTAEISPESKVFPESQWVLVVTKQQQKLFNLSDVVSTEIMLPGFSVAVDELLA